MFWQLLLAHIGLVRGIRLHHDIKRTAIQHSCGAADARARRAAVPRTAEHLAEAIGLLDPVEEGQDEDEQAKHPPRPSRRYAQPRVSLGVSARTARWCPFATRVGTAMIGALIPFVVASAAYGYAPHGCRRCDARSSRRVRMTAADWLEAGGGQLPTLPLGKGDGILLPGQTGRSTESTQKERLMLLGTASRA